MTGTQPPEPEPASFNLGFSDYDRKLVYEAFGGFGRRTLVFGFVLMVAAIPIGLAWRSPLLAGAVGVAGLAAGICGSLLVAQRRRILDPDVRLDPETMELLATNFRKRGLLEAEAAALRGRDAANRQG